MVTEGDETFGSAHTTQYTGDVQLENCTLETHTTLWTTVTPIIYKEKRQKQKQQYRRNKIYPSLCIMYIYTCIYFYILYVPELFSSHHILGELLVRLCLNLLNRDQVSVRELFTLFFCHLEMKEKVLEPEAICFTLQRQLIQLIFPCLSYKSPKVLLYKESSISPSVVM